jgi:hypothetical protein
VVAPGGATRPAWSGSGTCTPSSADAKAVSPPAIEERLVALAPLDGPSTWLKELPSLFTSTPVGGAAMNFTHDQPMIRGAQEIVPARLAQKT